MSNNSMQLKVVLPHQIFLNQSGVKRLVLLTRQGSMGILPHRLDCVVPLVPGVLAYETDTIKEQYLALDIGIMVKSGFEVVIAVRRAFKSENLQELHERIELEFCQQDEQEKQVHLALRVMRNELVRRFVELKTYE